MPTSPETASQNDFDSRGEFLIYSLFRSIFYDDQDTFIFSNVNYIGAGRSLHGNVDFILLDKEIIIFFEVKGTEIYYDKQTNKWYKSYERTKETDPFRQASDYLYDFRDKKLKRTFQNDYIDQKIAFGYAVLLPETLKPQGFSHYSRRETPWTIEYDPDITADITDCRNSTTFKKFIDQTRNYWFSHSQNKNKNGINNQYLNRLASYIRSDLKFEIPLPKYFEINEEQTRFYTKKQAETVLRMISSNHDKGFIVTGGPGTGKTLVARELLVNLTNQGKSVLMVCYSKPLADFLRDDIRNENSSILDYARIIDYNSLENINNENRWDYLIIDEGQDLFTNDRIDRLGNLLKGGYEKGNFLICLDKDTQNTYGIFDEGLFNLFKNIYPCIIMPLSENCRNTYGIIKTSTSYTGVPEMDCMKTTMTISRPEFWNNIPQLVEMVGQKIHELMIKGVAPRMITVLTMHSTIDVLTKSHKILTTWDRKTDFRFPKDKILVLSPEEFKGMENNIIIFTGSEIYNPENQMERAFWHVAFTRARDSLILLINFSLKEKLTQMYFKNNKPLTL